MRPFHHNLGGLLEVVLQGADQLLLVEGDDAGDPEEEEHEGLDGHGGPHHPPQEPVGSGQNSGVDFAIAETEALRTEKILHQGRLEVLAVQFSAILEIRIRLTFDLETVILKV